MATTLTPLTSAYKTQQGSIMLNDADWYQFITDHMLYIKTNATKIIIEPTDMEQYKYSLENFLREKQYDVAHAWIVRLINNIPSNQEFVGYESLLIPKADIITVLKDQYATLVQQATSAVV